MNINELFLIALIIIFSVPYFIWRVGNVDYWAPLVVVQIVTGILLGPGILGYFQPDVYNFIFTKDVIQLLNGVAIWAVTLFVFFAGLELNLHELKVNKKETAITSGLALGMPLLFGSIGAVVLLNYFPGNWMGANGQPWQFVLGLGMACAVTALPILILLMEKINILRQPIGQRILRYASLDDIAIWSVLAIILMDWNRLNHQLIFLISYALSSFAIRGFLTKIPLQDRIYVALVWLASVAFLADWAGLHFMVGAFLAGAVLDRHWFDEKQLDSLRNSVLLLMMPVFFLSTGLRTLWEFNGALILLVALFFFAVQLAGKMSGTYIAGRLLNWQEKESSLIGWLLQTKALIEIIFVSILLDKKIITSEMFTAMLLMAIVSTMITIPRITPMIKKMPHLVKKH